MKLPSGEYRRRLKRREGDNLHARALNFTCFGNQPFLRSERACAWTIDAIRLARAKHPIHLWAWCIMPTHVHLLIWPTTTECRVGNVLATIKLSVARRAIAWTKRHAPEFLPHMLDEQTNSPTSYRFWQRGAGYDRNITNPDSLLSEIRYIHRNPVDAGLCARPEDWPHSSFHEHRRPGAGPIALDRASMPRGRVAAH